MADRANIFETKDQTIGGAFTAENCTLDLGGTTGAIVQRVQFNIERPINFVYEISPENSAGQNVYYIGGRRRGQATFERVVGGSGTFKAFIDNYGPLCAAKGADIILKAKGGCAIGGSSPLANSKTITYTLKVPKITALGGSVSAQDIIIMETVQMVFLELKYEETAAGGGAERGGGEIGATI
jgi:hypothetical protein